MKILQTEKLLKDKKKKKKIVYDTLLASSKTEECNDNAHLN